MVRSAAEALEGGPVRFETEDGLTLEAIGPVDGSKSRAWRYLSFLLGSQLSTEAVDKFAGFGRFNDRRSLKTARGCLDIHPERRR